MIAIHTFFLITHILAGGIALILFWVPFFCKKGQLNHTRFGRYYSFSMYAVALGGAIMALMVLCFPIAIKGEGITDPEVAAKVSSAYRVFWSFLLYLSLLSYTTTRNALSVLKVKSNLSKLRTPMYVGPLVLLVLFGPLFIFLGIRFNSIIHIIFGVLGPLVGIGMLRYVFQKSIKPKAWILEHIGSMIGSGIGAYTAFVAFGARHILDNFEFWQPFVWSAPGVIGSIAAYAMTRHYQRVYKVA